MAGFTRLKKNVLSWMGKNTGELKTNDSEDEMRHLLVLAVPHPKDKYYKSAYSDIVKFHVEYAKAVIGKDNVLIVGERESLHPLRKELPADILLEVSLKDADIWMRDPMTVYPRAPVQFRYTAAAQDDIQADADFAQKKLNSVLCKKYGLEFARSHLLCDGGNFVDNLADKVVLTDRFLEDNKLSRADAERKIRDLFPDIRHVAVIPPEPEDVLAHADGMVMFSDDQHLAVADLGDPNLRRRVWRALEEGLPGVELYELPGAEAGEDERSFDVRYESAYGCFVNGVVTPRHLYLPAFSARDAAVSQSAAALVRQHTRRTVIGVEAGHVAHMGGSVRCLTWQVQGENARKLIMAARSQAGQREHSVK